MLACDDWWCDGVFKICFATLKTEHGTWGISKLAFGAAKLKIQIKYWIVGTDNKSCFIFPN